MATDCTYCGADIKAHDPLFVYEGNDRDEALVGRFCNYACLTAYVEEEELAVGAACQWTPS